MKLFSLKIFLAERFSVKIHPPRQKRLVSIVLRGWLTVTQSQWLRSHWLLTLPALGGFHGMLLLGK